MNINENNITKDNATLFTSAFTLSPNGSKVVILAYDTSGKKYTETFNANVTDIKVTKSSSKFKYDFEYIPKNNSAIEWGMDDVSRFDTDYLYGFSGENNNGIYNVSYTFKNPGIHNVGIRFGMVDSVYAKQKVTIDIPSAYEKRGVQNKITATVGWNNDYKYIEIPYAVYDKDRNISWETGNISESTSYTFSNASIYCSNLNLAGYSDWRLPSETELQSLITENVSNDTYVDYFSTLSSSQGSWYWTDSQKVINFGDGSTYGSSQSSNGSNFVRCVRSGDINNFPIIENFGSIPNIIENQELNITLNVSDIDYGYLKKEPYYSGYNNNYEFYILDFNNTIVNSLQDVNISFSNQYNYETNIYQSIMTIKPKTDIYGVLDLSHYKVVAESDGDFSKNGISLGVLNILNDLDNDGVADISDNDIDGDGVLNINDITPEDNKTFFTDSDNDGLIDSALNTDINNTIYKNYSFDPDFYKLSEASAKTVVGSVPSSGFYLNSSALTQVSQTTLNSSVNAPIVDISYSQFPTHLIKKYNILPTSSSYGSIALTTSTASPQVIFSTPLQGKFSSSKNYIWFKPNLQNAKKVSRHKLIFKLQDDPNALLKTDTSKDASIKISVYEGSDTSKQLGYKESNATDEIVIDLVLENDKEYLIKAESSNVKQMLFFTALMEQDDIYFETVKLDENGAFTKDLVVPVSGSYELVLNSYKVYDANLSKNGNLINSCGTESYYSKTHFDLNAYQYQLNIKGTANQEIELVLVESEELREIEPNDKILMATKYRKDLEYHGSINASDIDIFMIEKYSSLDTGSNFEVEIKSINNGSNIDLALIDSYGTVIDEYFGTISNGTLKYTTSLPTGVYYIKLTTNSTSNIDYSFTLTNTEFKAIKESNYELSIAKLYFAQLKNELFELDEILGSEEQQDSGNLIILTGDSDNPTDPLYIASQKLSTTFYNRFIQRGLSDDDIYWMNYNSALDIDSDGLNDSVIDSSHFSKNDFYNSITSWAVNSGKTGPLYIYMVDHGANGAFKISDNDKDENGQKEIVYSSELVKSIESFVEHTDRDVYIIIEACNSGSFIPMFANSTYSDKIAVIASSEAGKLSYIDKFGNVSFTKYVADEILSGKTIYKAYEDAMSKLQSLGGVYKNQIPMIFANTDELKNTIVGGAFSVAGISLTSIDSVYVDSIENSNSIDLTTKSDIKIDAKITADSGLKKVWATIIPPDFTTVLDDNFTTPNLAPYTKELIYNISKKEFETTYTIDSGTVYSGEYKITVFAEDNDGLVYSKTLTLYGTGQEEYNSNESNNTNTQITKTLTLANGWNLVALPVDLNLTTTELDTIFANAQTLWKYENNQWQVHSSHEAIKSVIQKANIGSIDSLKKAQGFWVNNSGMEQVLLKGNSYDTNITTLSSGWHLLGTGNEMNVSNLENSNIQVIWTYENSWRAYSPNSNIMSLITQSGITPLESIKQAQGFWVNVK